MARMYCAAINLFRSALIYLGNIVLNILTGIKLPLLPVSILYSSTAVFWLVLVHNLVIMMDLTLWKLNLLVLTKSISFSFLPNQFLYPITLRYHCLGMSHGLLCTFLLQFLLVLSVVVSTYSVDMVGLPTSCTMLPKYWPSAWFMCFTTIAACAGAWISYMALWIGLCLFYTFIAHSQFLN